MANGSLSGAILRDVAGGVGGGGGQSFAAGVADTAKAGIQLATLQDQVQSSRLQVQNKREKLEQQKYSTMYSILGRAARTSNTKVSKFSTGNV